jgi:hypothetical protein
MLLPLRLGTLLRYGEGKQAFPIVVLGGGGAREPAREELEHRTGAGLGTIISS